MSRIRSRAAAVAFASLIVGFAIVNPGTWAVGLALGLGMGSLALLVSPRVDDPGSAWAFRLGAVVFGLVAAAAAFEIPGAVRTGQVLGETVLGVILGLLLAVTVFCELTARRLYRVRTPR